MKKALKELFIVTIGVFIVTIGVFIGMLLNSWNESRKANDEAEKYLAGIYEEMNDNLDVLRGTLPYHQKLLKDLKEVPREVQLRLNPARISDLAWELAENSVFKNNIDKKTYYKLAKLYQLHADLVEIQHQASERMSEVNVIAPYYEMQLVEVNLDNETLYAIEKRIMMSWIPIFETWTYLEKEYMETLEEIVKK